jgi:cobyrinic acid a,c-diamide synthase
MIQRLGNAFNDKDFESEDRLTKDISLSIPRMVISAPHRSSGKTTVSIGICAALAESGKTVRAFKKGPDFIDPMWLASATGRDCYNLDYFMMGDEEILRSFQRNALNADACVIEGNMGLYDGMGEDGRGSTAELSRLLLAPVIIVVDARKMTRSIAPLLNGFQRFEPGTRVVAVLLNRVSSARHEAKLRAAIERYCDIEVVGAIPRMQKMEILERHLGLRPSGEQDGAVALINAIKNAMSDYVDLESIVRIAESAPLLEKVDSDLHFPAESASLKSVKIGVARDKAFTFYYPENLSALESAGAELVYFSPIADEKLPDVDGLYIGGGFPEVFMKELEKNRSIREQIRSAIENGMPVYAECGGLMYLARSIAWARESSKKESKPNDTEGVKTMAEMVGVLSCDAIMNNKPRGHGYIELKAKANALFESGSEIKAHEFHYSELEGVKAQEFAYDVIRGYGVDGSHDGILYKNVLASYAHLHAIAVPQWARLFVEFIKNVPGKKQ